MKIFVGGNLDLINISNYKYIENYISVDTIPSIRSNLLEDIRERDLGEYILKYKNVWLTLNSIYSVNDESYIIDILNKYNFKGCIVRDNSLLIKIKNEVNKVLLFKSSITSNSTEGYDYITKSPEYSVSNVYFNDNDVLMLFDDCTLNCKLRGMHHDNPKTFDVSICDRHLRDNTLELFTSNDRLWSKIVVCNCRNVKVSSRSSLYSKNEIAGVITYIQDIYDSI